MPLITTRVTTAQDATVKNSPLTNAEIDNNFININNAIRLSGDVTGFQDRTSSSLAWVDATRTLTLAPTGANFTAYYKGKAVTVSTPQTVIIANTNGHHWIHWDYTQNRLVDLGSNPNLKDNLLVAYIYWDSSSTYAPIVADERHSVSRDLNWHYYQHTTNGAIWKSGGDMSYTINNSNNVTLGFPNSSTVPIVLADEDLEHSIIHSDTAANPYEQNLYNSSTNVASLPILYLNGTTYKQTSVSATPWLTSSTRAYYNPITSGSGALAIAPTDNTYLVYWVVATNCSRHPIKLIIGRTMWNSYSEAETENFDAYGLSLPEIAPMYKIILQTSSTFTQNTSRVKIIGVRELVGKQNSRSNSFDTFSHDALSDRNLTNQHSISSITDLQTTLDSISGSAIAMSIALG